MDRVQGVIEIGGGIGPRDYAEAQEVLDLIDRHRRMGTTGVHLLTPLAVYFADQRIRRARRIVTAADGGAEAAQTPAQLGQEPGRRPGPESDPDQAVRDSIKARGWGIWTSWVPYQDREETVIGPLEYEGGPFLRIVGKGPTLLAALADAERRERPAGGRA